jgi:hypothetical protein
MKHNSKPKKVRGEGKKKTDSEESESDFPVDIDENKLTTMTFHMTEIISLTGTCDCSQEYLEDMVSCGTDAYGAHC